MCTAARPDRLGLPCPLLPRGPDLQADRTHFDAIGMEKMSKPDDEKKYWLEEPENITKIFYGVIGLCALVALPKILTLLDILLYKQGRFELADFFVFYTFFGVAGYVAMILLAKKLRNFLMRDEDYYD